jgi:hypothetical protein
MTKQVKSVKTLVAEMSFSKEMYEKHISKIQLSDIPSKAACQLTTLLTNLQENQRNFLVVPKASRSAKDQAKKNKSWDLQLERLKALIAKLNAIEKSTKKQRFSVPATNDNSMSNAA